MWKEPSNTAHLNKILQKLISPFETKYYYLILYWKVCLFLQIVMAYEDLLERHIMIYWHYYAGEVIIKSYRRKVQNSFPLSYLRFPVDMDFSLLFISSFYQLTGNRNRNLWSDIVNININVNVNFIWLSIKFSFKS